MTQTQSAAGSMPETSAAEAILAAAGLLTEATQDYDALLELIGTASRLRREIARLKTE
jgi:hypothetical protein